jgi:hypothetical protein
MAVMDSSAMAHLAAPPFLTSLPGGGNTAVAAELEARGRTLRTDRLCESSEA